MLKWSSEAGANMKTMPAAISTCPECQRRRWPWVWVTWRRWITKIARKTIVQTIASQLGRMFVAPCAALMNIDMPP